MSKTRESNSRKVIAIVDAYLTGTQIAQAAKDRGWKCISIRSSSELPDFLLNTYVPALYSEQLQYQGDLSGLSSKLKELGVSIVLPGAETGVELSEQISKKLDLIGNDPATNSWRRDKFRMIERLAQNGLHTAKQFIAASVDEVVTRLEANPCGWPVVLKPLNSAGTDGVSFCDNIKEAATNASKVLGKKNAIGYWNNEIVVQSYLAGTEYAVNMLCWGNYREVTDIWKYHKRKISGAGAIYDWQELMDPSGPDEEKLIAYLYRALDLLGVHYGPSHNEIMMTAEGPALVELGSRIQGSINQDILNRCTGANQLLKTLDLFDNPQIYMSTRRGLYKLHSHAFWIEMIAPCDAQVRNIREFESKIKELSSFHSVRFRMKESQSVYKTVDLLTSPGVLFLCHASESQLAADYSTFRSIEKRYFEGNAC